MNESHIRIYQSEDGKTEINVQLDNEKLWLSLNQLAELFELGKSVISKHINNIYKEKELLRKSTVAKYATVQKEGDREVERDIDFFDLDVIISDGYRIKSQRGSQFRILANIILKEYLLKGYALDKKYLANQNEQLKEL